MDFIDLLRDNNVRYWQSGQHHHVAEGFIGVDCHRCSPGSSKAKLGYCLNGGFLTCWTCGPIPLYETVKEITGLDGKKAVDLMKSLERPRWAKEEHRGTLELPKGLMELQTPHKRYLRERGFDPHELVKLWGVKGIGRAAKLAWRVFIPVIWRGATVSWTARSIQKEPIVRYANAEKHQERIPMKSVLYGADYVRHGIIVHEGPTDAWRTGPGAVATMGVAYTKEQHMLMAKYPKRIICFDSSPDAQRRAKKLCNILSLFDGETIRVELDADDPGSANEKETKALRRMIE
jgi:hypothetical protein